MIPISKLRINILANNQELIQRGLMHTKSLPEDECAFFIFPQASSCSFWNKNVPYDIDLGFFDSQGKLVQTSVLAAHQEMPIRCGHNVKYVVEANKGWFESNKIDFGTNVWNLVDLKSEEKEDE